MQAQFEALGKTMQSSMKSQFPNGSAVYKQQLKDVDSLRQQYNNLTMSSGAYSVESVKAVSATQSLSKAISDQKLTLSGALRNLQNFQAGWREQAALQKSSMMQWTNSTTGKNSVDLYMPKEGAAELDNFRAKYGYINQAIGSIATQTINWGKNTQWAGRQITVGIGMPLAMVAAAMAKSAYTADQDLTKITKVYNTSTDSMLSADQQQISTQNELAAVRKNAMQDAIDMAKQYGQSMDQTLQIESDLAAVGKTGNDLRTATAQVTKVATLGELDHNTALQMTITLMNAYKLSSAQLGDAFNYVNDIENTTSLTTQDFAEAIPRAGAALAGMGVTVQQTGVLLTAMKQGGVDATQGMNALKSATARLLNPTAAAKTKFAELGINIQSITQQAGGNLMVILEKLGEQLKGLPATTREAAMATLFGTYQFNKMNVALDNVSAAYDKYNNHVKDTNDQTLQALTVSQQDPSSWAAVANQEQAQLQQSISFQWKSTIAQIQTQMATLGQTVLKALLPVGKAVLSVVSWFNSWGDTSKKIALVIAGMVMLAGPLIMLLGLFANLVGNVVKFGSSMSNLVLRFKVLDPEQRASELMAKQAASAFDAEAGSISRLNMELQNMIKLQVASNSAGGVVTPGLTGAAAAAQNQALMNYANINTGKTPLSGAPLPIPTGRGNSYRNPNTGRMMSAADVAAMQAAAKAADQAALDTQAMQNATEKTGLNVGKWVGKLGMFGVAAFSLKGMLDSSGGLVGNLAQAAMFATMMAGSGAFAGIGKTIKGIPTLLKGATSGLGTMAAKGAMALSGAYGRAGGSIGSVLSTAGKGLLGFMTGPTGIVAGVALVAAGYISIVNHMNAAAQKQDEINHSTEAWAQVLGFAEKSYATAASGGAADPISQWDARQKKVDALTKANGALVDSLKEANTQAGRLGKVYNIALDEAFKVHLAGGSVQQAQQAFDVALQAAGLGTGEIKQLDMKFDSVKVDDPKQITDHIQKQLSSAVSSMNVSTGIGANWMRKISNSTISEDAQKSGEKIGGAFWEGLQNSKSKTDVASVVKDVFDTTGKEFQKDDSWKSLWSHHSEQMKSLGIHDVQEYYKAYQDYQNGTGNKKNNEIFGNMIMDDTDAGNVEQRYSALMDFVWKTIKDKTHMSKAEFDKLKASGFDLDTVTSLLGGSLGVMGDQASAAANAMNNLDSSMKNPVLTGDQITSALQSTMKGYMSDVYNEADNIMSEQYQAQIDGINKAGQARQKAFDVQGKALDKSQKAESDALKKSQDARSQAFDDQIKQAQDAAQAQEDSIQAQIDAENKQDETRQKLFDREKTRIERLAQMQNDSIDFNSALNSGNMDSAAKLYNSHAATVQGYQIDDQNTKASEDLKATTDGQSAQIKAIKDATDAKVAILQSQKDALKDVFDYENSLLDEKQQKEKDALDAAKQADSDRTASAAASAQKRQALNKLELDQELMARKAQTPRTKEEAQKQIDDMTAIYKKYGVSLNANAEEWTTYIGNDLTAQVGTAAAALQNTIDWQTLGNNITTLLGAGAGLSTDQLKQFLSTGNWPASAAPPTINPATGYYVGADGKIHSGKKASHQGGFQAPNGKLSWTQKERMGYPADAAPYQSEIPTLLRHGEYVVNDKATAANLPLLNHINAGGSIEGLMGARHIGGAALFGASASDVTNSFGTAIYLSLANRMTDYANARLAERFAPGAGASIAGDISASAIGGADQNGMTWKALDAIRRQLFPTSVLTSAYRAGATGPTGKKDFHNLGMAIDIGVNGNAQSGLMPIASTIAKIFPGSTELIHNPNGSIKNGRSVPASFWGPATWAEHASHVHWAMTPADLAKAKASAKFDNGGYLQNGMTGFNQSGKPEPVFTADQWGLLSKLVGNSANVLTVAGSKDGAFATGTQNTYTVTVDLRGAYVKEDVNIKKAVEDALYEINNKNGMNRKVGNGS